MSRRARFSGPTWEVPLATLLHAAGFALIARVGQCTSASAPLFKSEDVLVVEMAGELPRTNRMVQKAERTPDVAAGAVPTPTVPTPPDSMALRDPKREAAGDPAADRAREALIRELRKQAALKDLSAPLGDEDRAAASPDGVDGATAALGSGRPTDPELARWWASARPVVQDGWKPLRSICTAHPELVTEVGARVEGDGRVTGTPRVLESSGDVSFDESARRALLKSNRLPPLPAKFADGLDVTLTFACKDVL